MICVKIFLYLRHVKIAPDDIVCLIDIASFGNIILGQIVYGRQMITVHYHNRIFIEFFHFRQKFLYPFIHLMDLVGIVLPLPFQFIRGCFSDLDDRIFQHFFPGIFTMSLDGYRIDIVLAFGRFECIKYLLCQDFILRPVLRGLADTAHIFQRSESLESQIRQRCVAIVKCTAMVMYTVC